MFAIAVEANDWEQFTSSLDHLAKAVNEPKADRWRLAAGAIRTGQFVPEAPFDRLSVAETECGYHVERLDFAAQFTPTDNRVDVYFIPVPQAA